MNENQTQLPTDKTDEAVSGTMPQRPSTMLPPMPSEAQLLPKYVPTSDDSDAAPTRTLPQGQAPQPPGSDTAGTGQNPYFASSPYADSSGTMPGTHQSPSLNFSTPLPKPTVGESRFTIIRELAKGGMGQVLVAMDQELDRQVALKEIQPRYARDRSITSRFLLEARVTGRLEHPGIVPVYGLNHYPDGRPYYAMRFITGESFQDAIQTLHKSGMPFAEPEQMLQLRKLLTRFVDVCNTIAYAHNRGILHRDLKPANIMLGAYGETLVVDWGLAKDLNVAEKPSGETTMVIPKLAFERSPAPTDLESFPASEGQLFAPTQTLAQVGPSPSLNPEFVSTRQANMNPFPASLAGPYVPEEAELTEIGKAMGTPAFMAPEQADGRWDDVGPPADIYSLGATLYSILTGKAPFRGETLDILERVKRGEITPISDVRPDVPKPLIAVCLKAMAVDPFQRYGTSLELAADLERWMADEPVSAYLEPWTVRLHRWANRHRNTMFAVSAILVTALATISIGFVMVNAEQKRTDAAYEELKVQEKNVRDARDRAELNREEAREALLALTDDAIGEILAGQQSMTAKQREFLTRILGMYQRFVREAPESHDSRLFVASATTRIGRLQYRLGEAVEAEKAYLSVLELAPKEPTPEWEAILGDTHLYYGILLNLRGRQAEAVEQLRKGREKFFQLITNERTAKRDGKPEHWYRLGQSEDRLGFAYYVQGNQAEAEAWFRNALTNREVLLQMRPDVPEYQYRVAQSLRQIAMVCHSRGDRTEALVQAERARTIILRLLLIDPTSAVYLVLNAELDSLMSTILVDDATLNRVSSVPSLAKVSRNKPAAETKKPTFRLGSPTRFAVEAVDAWSELVSLYPSEIGYRLQLATSHYNLGGVYQKVGSADKATEALRSATTTLDDLERRGTNERTMQSLRGRIAHLRAVLKREASNYREAEPFAREAVRIAEELLVGQPGNPRWENDLAYYQLELAAVLLLSEKPAEAERMLSNAWENTLRATTRPGVSLSDQRLWECVRIYARLYADLLSDIKRYDQVDVVAKRLLEMNLWTTLEQFEAAALYGRAAILVIREKNLDLPEQQRLADEFVDKSMRLLEKLDNKPAWRNIVLADPDLSAVRFYEDFDELITKFREPAPPPREREGER